MAIRHSILVPTALRLLTFLLLATLLGAGSAVAQNLPDGFAHETVFPFSAGFANSPIGFELLPDGRLIVIDRDADVFVALPYTNTFLNIFTVPDVTSASVHSGLLGMAIDPAWPVRPYVYFLYTHVDSIMHVAMYTASGDLSDPGSTNITLSNHFILIDDLVDNQDIHNGGTLRFGPDDMLYISIGDDNDACRAQDLTTLQGKILRIDVSAMPDTGTGPPPKALITPSNNPFPGPDENEKLVYAWGLRNPWKFTIDAPTGDLFIGDVGAMAWEEVNIITSAGYTGSNFGWPQYEGPDSLTEPWLQCGVNPLTFADYQYPHDSTSSYSVMAGPVYRGAATSLSFPAEYEGDYFFQEAFGELATGGLRRLTFDGNAWVAADPVPGQPDAVNWGTELGFVVDMQLGDDGALYYSSMFTTLIPRGIYRIVAVTATDVQGTEASIPQRTWAVPNPAEALAGTTIHYRVPHATEMTMDIYDVRGRLVRTLTTSSSHGTIHWNGRTNDQKIAGPGVYLYRLQSDGETVTHGKVTLIR